MTRAMHAWASWVRAWARTLNAPTERATSDLLASLQCPMCGGRP